MTPVSKVIALRPDVSVQDAAKLSAASGIDRLPVITSTGQATGLVNVLDILLDQNGEKPLSNYVRRIVTTTEDELAHRVAHQLRAARLGLAAVLDGNKNLSGIVTIEDLLRRLISPSSA